MQSNLCILSLLYDSLYDNLYAYVIWVHVGKATHAKQNCMAGFATKNLEAQNSNSTAKHDGKMVNKTDFPFKFPTWTQHK